MSQSSTGAERERATSTFSMDALKWISGIASLVGLWIAASPFVYETTDVATWNNVAVGAAIFLIAGFTYYQFSRGIFPALGALSLVVLLGLWTIAAPYAMDFDSDALLVSNVAAGAAVALLAAYNAYANREAQAATTGTRA